MTSPQQAPMGPVSMIGAGDSFEHAHVRVGLTDDANGITAQLTDGSLVEPFHETFEVTLENGMTPECHAFYHPISRHGVACIAMPEEQLAVRSIDMSGLVPEPVTIDFEGAEPGFDEQGRLMEQLKHDTTVHYGPGGTIAVEMPEDQLPEHFRSRKLRRRHKRRKDKDKD